MIFHGKYKLLNIPVTACDYEFIVEKVKSAIKRKKRLLICPIPSHSFVLALFKPKVERALQSFDYKVPCAQWVKRSLNFLYDINLKKRVYGPNLTLKICEVADKEKYNIFLYGSTQQTVKKVKKNLKEKFPSISIVGDVPSKFSPLTLSGKKGLIVSVEKSKADILFVCLGSPLQELFVYDLIYKNPKLKTPMVIVTVGATFDFIAGTKLQAPEWIQEAGFEWLFRLLIEPKRLWKRYLIYDPLFILLVAGQKLSKLLEPSL